MGDKIKFGFNKIIKKPNLLPSDGSNLQEKSKIELINEIEGSSIKVAGFVNRNFRFSSLTNGSLNCRKNPDDEKEQKLIIPMTNDQKTTPLAKLLAQKKLKNLVAIKVEAENGYENPATENPVPMDVDIKKEPLNETLEQQAARELVEDLQTKSEKSETKIFEVPVNADELPLEGAKESSMDDYERVPISDFGKAMLRGMGWKEEEKKDDKKPWLDAPVQRPKGMGLGADKVIKKQPLLIAPNQSETLEVKKNACVKVLAGKHKNLYGTVSLTNLFNFKRHSCRSNR
jgi:G patch domain and KOW motifs-containing protein